MSKAVLREFLSEVSAVNKKFNIGRSSLKHLVAALEQRIKSQDWSAITLADALRLTKNPNDGRLGKYRNAMQTMCDNWGLQQNPAVAVQTRAVFQTIPPPAAPTVPSDGGVIGRSAAAVTGAVGGATPRSPRLDATAPPGPPPLSNAQPATFTPALLPLSGPRTLPQPPGSPPPVYVPVRQVPATVNPASTASTIQACSERLLTYGGYAVGDAVTFGGSGEVKRRCLELQADAKRSEQMKRAEQAAGGKEQYPQSTLTVVRGMVEEARGGICTTFACAAASVLTQGRRQNLSAARVEIFATNRGLATHLYVVVGRQLGSALNRPKTWGQDCRVVDCWAMAMKFTNSPVQNPAPWPDDHWMLTKVQCYYDSAQPDPDLSAVASRGLERLVTVEQRLAENRRVQQSQATSQPAVLNQACPICGKQMAEVLLKNHQAKCSGSAS